MLSVLAYFFFAANAPQAAAVRVLADFIFAFCFHFISNNHFPYRQTPHWGCLLVMRCYYIISRSYCQKRRFLHRFRISRVPLILTLPNFLTMVNESKVKWGCSLKSKGIINLQCDPIRYVPISFMVSKSIIVTQLL